MFLMHLPCAGLFAYPLEPTGESRIGMTCEPNEHRHTDAFCQKPEHEFNLFVIGFEVTTQGVAATDADFGAGPALESLNTIAP